MDRKKHVTELILLCCTLLVGATTAMAQAGAQTRSITADDFVAHRPGANTPAKSRRASKPVNFKLVRKERIPKHWGAHAKGSVNAKSASSGHTATSDLGVTIWKLRRPLSTDKGARLPVSVGNS